MRVLTLIYFLLSSFLLFPQDTQISGESVRLTGTLHTYEPMAQFDRYLETDSIGICGIRLSEHLNQSQRQEFDHFLDIQAQIWVEGILEKKVIAPNGQLIHITAFKRVDNEIFINLSHEAHIRTDSFLTEEINGTSYSYPPRLLLDGDLSTCWAENKDGNGIGEVLTVSFPTKVFIQKLAMDIGFDRSASLFFANGRIKEIEIALENQEVFTHRFHDKRGLQVLELPDSIAVKSFEIKILDVFPGSLYQDTCISEIEIWGHKQSTR